MRGIIQLMPWLQTRSSGEDRDMPKNRVDREGAWYASGATPICPRQSRSEDPFMRIDPPSTPYPIEALAR